MRKTIKDVAKYTGLSPTAISLVLNGKGDKIPDKTKKRIHEAVEALGYRPNQIAVGLTKKQTRTIGLIICDIRNIYFSNLAKGIEDECRNNSWNLILCNTNDLHERDFAYIQVLADKGVDGILYTMSADSTNQFASDSLKLIDSTHIPYLMVDRTLKKICPYYVVTNHRLGGYLCTQHLIDLGHERIACITGPTHLEDSADRLAGYKDALQEHGIPYDSSLVINGDYTFQAGKEGVKSLIGRDYTGLFAFNDMTAYGAYTQLKKMGVSIPDDMSLIGYDDIFFSELLDIPLTTLHQPVYELGQEAARRIIHWNTLEEDQKKEIVLEPHLVIRESTKRRK